VQISCPRRFATHVSAPDRELSYANPRLVEHDDGAGEQISFDRSQVRK
jgi:hypothetical protein